MFIGFVYRVSFVFKILKDKVKIQEHYDITAEVGKGNFSVVKLGICKETGTKYAVKEIDISKFEKFTKNRNTSLNLDSEEKMLKALKHNNIVSYRELIAEKDKLYLITEFMGGGDL